MRTRDLLIFLYFVGVALVHILGTLILRHYYADYLVWPNIIAAVCLVGGAAGLTVLSTYHKLVKQNIYRKSTCFTTFVETAAAVMIVASMILPMVMFVQFV